MFEVVAGATPGQLRPETRQACIKAAVQIIGGELRQMAKVLKEISPVQRALLKLHLCEALQVIGVDENREHKKTLEPAGAPEYRPTLRSDAASRS